MFCNLWDKFCVISWIFYHFFYLAVHWGILYTHSSFPLLGPTSFCMKVRGQHLYLAVTVRSSSHPKTNKYWGFVGLFLALNTNYILLYSWQCVKIMLRPFCTHFTHSKFSLLRPFLHRKHCVLAYFLRILLGPKKFWGWQNPSKKGKVRLQILFFRKIKLCQLCHFSFVQIDHFPFSLFMEDQYHWRHYTKLVWTLGCIRALHCLLPCNLWNNT